MYDILLMICHFLTTFKRYFVYFNLKIFCISTKRNTVFIWNQHDFKHRNLHLAQRIMNDLTNTNFFNFCIHKIESRPTYLCTIPFFSCNTRQPIFISAHLICVSFHKNRTKFIFALRHLHTVRAWYTLIINCLRYSSIIIVDVLMSWPFSYNSSASG